MLDKIVTLRSFVICTRPIVQEHQIRKDELSRHVRMGENTCSYRALAGKPDGKIALGRPRRRWVNNNNNGS
jgi:hypothetical protein